MKRLFLLRHAKADPGPDDLTRPLAPRGLRDSFWLGQYIKKNHILPDFALCSSAKRTRETLAQLQTGAATLFPTLFREDFYLASSQYITDQIRMLGSDIAAPIIIGHNPSISLLFQKLSHVPPQNSQSLKYPTGTLAVLNFNIEDWSDLESNTGQLIAIITASDKNRGPG